MKTFSLLCVLTVFYFSTSPIFCNQVTSYVAVIHNEGESSGPRPPYFNYSQPVRAQSLARTTTYGKTQLRDLGKCLRQRYPNLVSKNYDPAEANFKALDICNVFSSTNSLSSGLYESENNSPDWDMGGAPVHATTDGILSMDKKCQKRDKEKDSELKEEAKQQENNEDMLRFIAGKAGIEIKTSEDIYNFYHLLKLAWVNESHPDWIMGVGGWKNISYELEPRARYGLTVGTSTDSLARLQVGPLLKEIMQNMMKAKLYRDTKPTHWQPLKLNVYGGTDINIVNVLNALNIYDGPLPEFASAVIFELIYDDATELHMVRVFFKNSTGFEQLSLPECGKYCSLEYFSKNIAYLIPDNWEEECILKEWPVYLLTFQLVSGLRIYVIVANFYIKKITNTEN